MNRHRPLDPAPPSRAHTTNETKSRTCPMCGEAFGVNVIGRPRIFCSNRCRREMHALREGLPLLQRELDETRRHIVTDYGGRRHYWQAHARTLELAIAEARMRLGGTAP